MDFFSSPTSFLDTISENLPDFDLDEAVIAPHGFYVQEHSHQYIPSYQPPQLPSYHELFPFLFPFLQLPSYTEATYKRPPQKRQRTKRTPSIRSENNACARCNTLSTPQWRRGPDTNTSLCNACGLRYLKEMRKKGIKGRNHQKTWDKKHGIITHLSHSPNTTQHIPLPLLLPKIDENIVYNTDCCNLFY